MRPVCIGCQLEMRCTKVGALIELMTAEGPYQLWSCDVYTCPECAFNIAAKPAATPIAEHFQADYPQVAEKRYARAWQNERERWKYNRS